MKKAFALLLLLALLVSLFGCGNRGTVNLDAFQQLLENNGGEYQADVPFADKVYVIIPQNASSVLSAKADALTRLIYEKTSVDTVLKYDNEATVLLERELEILVGMTNRLASREALKKLKLEDYLCKWDKGKIILGGRYEAATVAAIDKFCETVLHGASESSLMNEDTHFESFQEYEVKGITLNGYDLYDYTIVYDFDNSHSEKQIAQLLRSYIAEKSGYWLEIISDKDVRETTGKQIAISGGEQALSYDGVIETEDRGVALYGKTSYSLSLVACAFLDRLVEGKSLENGLKLSGGVDCINAGALVICDDGADSDEYLKNVMARLTEALALTDVVVFQDIPASSMVDIKNSMPQGVKLFDIADGVIAAYKEEKVERLSGSNTDGILDIQIQTKQNGQSFRLVCVTASSSSTDEKLKQLLKSGDCDLLIYNNVDTNGRFDSHGLPFASGGTCSAGQSLRHQSLYVRKEGLNMGQAYRISSSGEHSAMLLCSVELWAKYSPEFIDMTKAFE